MEPIPVGLWLTRRDQPRGSARVIRGGDWYDWYGWGLTRGCRSARRSFIGPDYRINYFGFRAVLAPGQP